MKANPAQHRERDEEACCLICYEEGPDVFHLGCPGSHTFCGACLTHWLTSGDPGALLDAAANLPHCPSCKQEKGPPGHIPLEMLPLLVAWGHMTAEQEARFHRQYVRLTTNDTIYSCVNPACDNQFAVEAPDPETAQRVVFKDAFKVTCSSCHVVQCAACGVPWGPHAGLTCDRYRARGAPADEATRKLLASSVPCPGRCGQGLQRSSGCNVLLCVACKLYVCYLCGEGLDSSKVNLARRGIHPTASKHYQVPGKPCYEAMFKSKTQWLKEQSALRQGPGGATAAVRSPPAAVAAAGAAAAAARAPAGGAGAPVPVAAAAAAARGPAFRPPVAHKKPPAQQAAQQQLGQQQQQQWMMFQQQLGQPQRQQQPQARLQAGMQLQARAQVAPPGAFVFGQTNQQQPAMPQAQGAAQVVGNHRQPRFVFGQQQGPQQQLQTQPVHMFGQPQGQQAAFGQPPAQQGLFGQPQAQQVAFGPPQAQRVAFEQPQGQQGLFGQPQAQQVAFGPPQAQRVAFEQPQGQQGLFGQPQAQQGLFQQPQGQQVAAGQTLGQQGRPEAHHMAFGQPQAQQGLFVFGQAQAGQGLFGQPQAKPVAFGQASAQQGLFGQPQAQQGVFGQPQAQQGVFGQPQAQQGVFVQPQGQQGLFQQLQAQQVAFGQSQGQQQGLSGQPPAQLVAFGQAQAQQGVVQKKQAQHGLFGQPQAPYVMFGPGQQGLFGHPPAQQVQVQQAQVLGVPQQPQHAAHHAQPAAAAAGGGAEVDAAQQRCKARWRAAKKELSRAHELQMSQVRMAFTARATTLQERIQQLDKGLRKRFHPDTADQLAACLQQQQQVLAEYGSRTKDLEARLARQKRKAAAKYEAELQNLQQQPHQQPQQRRQAQKHDVQQPAAPAAVRGHKRKHGSGNQRRVAQLQPCISNASDSSRDGRLD